MNEILTNYANMSYKITAQHLVFEPEKVYIQVIDANGKIIHTSTETLEEYQTSLKRLHDIKAERAKKGN